MHAWLADPSIAPRVEAFVDECTAFPKGANDDQVDCCTQALKALEVDCDSFKGSIGSRTILSPSARIKPQSLAQRFGNGDLLPVLVRAFMSV